MVMNNDLTLFQVPERKPKFPRPQCDIKQVQQTLFSIYQKIVANTNSEFILDKETKENLRRVALWIVNSPNKGLLLIGSLGNGKTTMLRTLKAFLNGTGNWVGPICEASSIWEAERYTYLENLEDENVVRSKNLIYHCKTDKILIIDDLGVENEKCKVFGEERCPLEHVLLHRYSSDLTTIISTNLPSLDVIEKRYGPRLVDRMYETYDRIVFTAESYRRKRR